MCKSNESSNSSGLSHPKRKELPIYSREEVAKHNSYEDAWIIVEDKVYDITTWGMKHPGGRVIFYYRGEDATEPVFGFHPDMVKTHKYMKVCLVGQLSPEDYKQIPPVIEDFRELRKDLEKEGYFNPNPTFYLLHLLQIFVLEAIAAYSMYAVDSIWLAAAILATAQIQAGWLQHDFGHCAVFESAYLNQLSHYFIIGHLKGAVSWWWKSRHNRHHAKTNIIKLDPDMHTEPIFSFTDDLVSKSKWKVKRRFVPFLAWQHIYWFFLGPPMVTTLLFLYENVEFMATRAVLMDIAFVVSFYIRYDFIYGFFVTSVTRRFMLFFAMRFLESHWFTWVTSMNHLPMPKEEDTHNDWVHMQLKGTQNVTTGALADWFTGHLNYQIEHHLFPNMPRHSYPEVSKRVKQLCEKHGVQYNQETLIGSCIGIVRRLKEAGVQYADYCKRHPRSDSEPSVPQLVTAK